MTDMACGQVEQAVTEYALGILPADEARAVSVHVLRCPACRQEVADIQDIGERLLDLVPDAEPPLGLDQEVLSAVRRHEGRRPGRLQLVLAAAAAVVIAIAAVTATALFSRDHHPQPAALTAVLRQLPNREPSEPSTSVDIRPGYP